LFGAICEGVTDIALKLHDRAALQNLVKRLVKERQLSECCRRRDHTRCIPCQVVPSEIVLADKETVAIIALLSQCKQNGQQW
jgi:hypothetical protein